MKFTFGLYIESESPLAIIAPSPPDCMIRIVNAGNGNMAEYIKLEYL